MPDIAEQLRVGNWLVLMYHYDCPNCKIVIKKLISEKESFQNKYGNIAFIEIPPYGENVFINAKRKLTKGSLSNSKDWFVRSPLLMVMQDARILQVVN